MYENQITEIKRTTTNQINELKQHFESIISQQRQIIDEQSNVIQSIQSDLHTINNYNKLKIFKYQQGKEFDGILRSLSNETGGNIHNNGTIQITTNSQYSNYVPQNIVNFDTNSLYHSENIKDTYLLFDFKNKIIQLSNYSIMSHSSANSCLRNWVVEASNDGKIWEEIDKHNEDSSLNGEKNENTFNISQKNRNFYRYIKLRQTGKKLA